MCLLPTEWTMFLCTRQRTRKCCRPVCDLPVPLEPLALSMPLPMLSHFDYRAESGPSSAAPPDMLPPPRYETVMLTGQRLSKDFGIVELTDFVVHREREGARSQSPKASTFPLEKSIPKPPSPPPSYGGQLPGFRDPPPIQMPQDLPPARLYQQVPPQVNSRNDQINQASPSKRTDILPMISGAQLSSGAPPPSYADLVTSIRGLRQRN
jgi:hypothetical protein